MSVKQKRRTRVLRAALEYTKSSKSSPFKGWHAVNVFFESNVDTSQKGLRRGYGYLGKIDHNDL
jgi:hypothetical protein